MTNSTLTAGKRIAPFIDDPDGSKRAAMGKALAALVTAGIQKSRFSQREFLAPYRAEIRQLQRQGHSLEVIASELSRMTNIRVSVRALAAVLKADSPQRPRKRKAEHNPNARQGEAAAMPMEALNPNG